MTDMREAFEREAMRAGGFNLQRDGMDPERYWNTPTEHAWQGFQLAWQSQQAQGEAVNWEARAKGLEKVLEGYREENQALKHFKNRLKQAEDYAQTLAGDENRSIWFWQGDGEDHPESMVSDLTVVISALELRELMATPAPAAVPDWRPMETAPKDHTILQLLVQKSDLPDCFDAEEPDTLSRSIGFNGLDHTGDDEWHLVGWNWQQDHFNNSLTVEPVGWLPMAPLPDAAPASAEPGRKSKAFQAINPNIEIVSAEPIDIETELPPLGEPFIGYHPDWVDDDFNPKGVRDCHRHGDGSEYQSAKWNGIHDCWDEDEQPPTHWLPFPTFSATSTPAGPDEGSEHND